MFYLFLTFDLTPFPALGIIWVLDSCWWYVYASKNCLKIHLARCLILSMGPCHSHTAVWVGTIGHSPRPQGCQPKGEWPTLSHPLRGPPVPFSPHSSFSFLPLCPLLFLSLVLDTKNEEIDSLQNCTWDQDYFQDWLFGGRGLLNDNRTANLRTTQGLGVLTPPSCTARNLCITFHSPKT